MKQTISILIACLLSLSGFAQTSPYTGTSINELTDGDYYIYNVETGKWLGDNTTNTARYTSRAELGVRGLDIEVTAVSGGYRLNPKLGGNHSINASNLYMDTTSGLTTWKLAPAEGAINTVTITSGSYTLGADAEGLLVNNAIERKTWQFVTREERIAVDCKGATMNKPVDLSWAIYGGTFPIADERKSLWQGPWHVNNVTGDGYYHCNRLWEMSKIKGTEVFQQLNDLPNGTYGIAAQAFYASTGVDDLSADNYAAYKNGTEKMAGYVFAGDEQVPMNSYYSLATNKNTANLNTLDLGNNVWIPSSATQISNHIFEGRGQTEQARATVTQGRLKFGVRVSSGTGSSWILFDNFQLFYYGADGVSSPLQQKLASISSVEYRRGERAHLCLTFEGTSDVSFDHNVVSRTTVTDASGKVIARGVSATNYYDGKYNPTSIRITLSKELSEGKYTLTIPANSLLLKELSFDIYSNAVCTDFTATSSGNPDGDMVQQPEEINETQTYYDGVRIGWQYNRQKYVGPGSYGRAIRMNNGEYAMVYSTGGGGNNIGGNNYIRFQRTPYGNWTTPKVLKSQNNYCTQKNTEIIQLPDGRLMYAWLYRTNFSNSKEPSKIMAAYSSDYGATWKDEQIIYTATQQGGLGVWEPAMVVLPTGELQIYFANEASVGGGAQNISMRRSFNMGRSWQPGTEIVSYRSEKRDGMPVPVYLKNQKGIAVAIEDPGFMGTFKPMVVHTDATDNWKSGYVDGSSSHRWSIFQNSADYLDSKIYCGQPYLIQLNTGETVYSACSGQDRSPSDRDLHARLAVYVGNSQAKNFIARSFPFPFTNNPNACSIWNSIMQYNDSTLMAVCTNEEEVSRVGIWTSEGKIMRPMPCHQTGSIRLWNNHSEYLFLGAESQAEARVKSMWNEQNLYFHFEVADKYVSRTENTEETDAVEVYFITRTPSTTTSKAKQYRFRIDVNGKVTGYHGSNTRWVEDQTDINPMVSSTENGYNVDIAIPWSALGGIPTANSLYCCYQLHNFDTVSGITTQVHEVFSGSDIEKASTWIRMPIVEDLSQEDGIIDIKGTSNPSNGEDANQLIYNLSGQRLASPQHGINIISGRKVVVDCP